MSEDIVNGILVYGGLALITAICADLSVRKSSKPINVFFALLTILIPSIFAGLRYGIGTDYYSYQEGFTRIKNYFDVDTEFLYLYINKFVAFIGLDFQTVLFITAFITTLFIYLSLKNYQDSIYIGVGMLVYMLMYYQISFNAIRQIAAMAIILFSIKYIHERKLIKFTLFILLAMGFHETALLFYPIYFLYFLYGTNKHKLLKIVSFSILILIMINYSTILFPVISSFETFSYYADSYLRTEKEFELGVGIFFRTLPFILAGFLFRKELTKSHEFILIFNIMIIGCISLLTAYSSENYTERISYYFLSTLIIFVPYICKLSKTHNKYVIGIIVVLSVIALWYMDFIYLGRNETIPYQWIISR